jgi:hypothetical protein
VDLKVIDAGSRSWGALEPAGATTLDAFLEALARGDPWAREAYLHDWSLPRGCASLFGPPPYADLRVPKYFAGDYFQRTAFSGYRHAWPSLFVGAAGTESAMHVDSGGTNFMLHLLSGSKEWRVFDRDEIPLLYPHDRGPRFRVDPFRSTAEEFPLLRHATARSAVQRPGETVFIPAGSPHAVRNLEDIHALSSNYVDGSNYWLHLWECVMEGEWEQVERLASPDFPRGWLVDRRDQTWGEFTGRDWSSVPPEQLVRFGEEAGGESGGARWWEGGGDPAAEAAGRDEL